MSEKNTMISLFRRMKGWLFGGWELGVREVGVAADMQI